MRRTRKRISGGVIGATLAGVALTVGAPLGARADATPFEGTPARTLRASCVDETNCTSPNGNSYSAVLTNGSWSRIRTPQAVSALAHEVAFHSQATNLLGAGEDANGVTDVFVRDLTQRPRQTELVSRASDVGGVAGEPGNGASTFPITTSDGRWVVYQSTATNLASGVTIAPGSKHVYRRDRLTGSTELVSAKVSGGTVTPGDGASEMAVVSGDGRYVAFESAATNLAPAGSTPLGGRVNIYLRDMSPTGFGLKLISDGALDPGGGSSRWAAPAPRSPRTVPSSPSSPTSKCPVTGCPPPPAAPTSICATPPPPAPDWSTSPQAAGRPARIATTRR